MSDFESRGISAAKWGVVLSALRVVLQLGSQVVLARILGPEIYGIFGIALVVITLTTYFADFGIGMYLVQGSSLTEVDIRFATTWLIVLGAITAAAVTFGAPWIADAFNEPRVAIVLPWLSLTCVLVAATYTANHLQFRDLQFRAAGVIDLLSYLVGYVLVGVPLALAGLGVTALVAAFVSQAGVKFAATVYHRPHAWRPQFKHPEARAILRLCRSVWFTLLVSWIMNSLDRVIVGRYMGVASVGLYNAAFNLANAAISSMNTLSATFLSASARFRDDPERLRRVYVEVFAGVWVIAAPLFVLAAMHSDTIIAVIYGSKWVGAGDVLCALLVAAPAWLSFVITSPLLWNTGRGYLEPLVQLPVIAGYALALYLAVDHGLVVVAWAVAGVMFVRAIAVAWALAGGIGLTLRDVLPQLMRGLVLCGIVVVGAQIGLWLGGGEHVQLVGTALSIVMPVAALLLLVAFVPAALGASARSMLLRAAPSLRGWFGPGVSIEGAQPK